jgi:two-component system, NarL family, sensor histidine kinase DevS
VGSDAGSHPEFLPQLQLDELLSELQGRLHVVLAARDQMRGLLEAVIAISSGLDLESTLRRIVQTAVRLVDATYGALGVLRRAGGRRARAGGQPGRGRAAAGVRGQGPDRP